MPNNSCTDDTKSVEEFSQFHHLIEVKDVTVKWPLAGNEGNTLTDLSFTVGSGQLFAIAGHVGAGKVYINCHFNTLTVHLFIFLTY